MAVHKKRQRSMEQTREYNIVRNPCWCFQLIYEKGTKNTHWGRTVSAKDGVWETGQLHAKG